MLHHSRLKHAHPPLTTATTTRAQASLAALQHAYGPPNVTLLRVNTRAAALHAGATPGDTPQQLPPDLFRAVRRACLPGGGAGEPDGRPPEPPGGLGAALAPADLAAAGQLLRDFTQGCLLPRLEERVSRLNLSVTAMRKGFKNRLTRLWKAGTGGDGGGLGAGGGGGAGTGGGSGGAGAGELPPYAWHTVEAQMRQLADLALLLGFNEFAVATYRLAAQVQEGRGGACGLWVGRVICFGWVDRSVVLLLSSGGGLADCSDLMR